MTTHSSNMVLDALDDHISPSREVLGDHREGMDSWLGVFCEATEFMSVELAELDRICKVWDLLLNGLWVGVLGRDGGERGVGVGGLVGVARWRIYRHGRIRHCGSVILVCTRASSFYRRLSQAYQTNCNEKWLLRAVMMVQVRVGDE